MIFTSGLRRSIEGAVDQIPTNETRIFFFGVLNRLYRKMIAAKVWMIALVLLMAFAASIARELGILPPVLPLALSALMGAAMYAAINRAASIRAEIEKRIEALHGTFGEGAKLMSFENFHSDLQRVHADIVAQDAEVSDVLIKMLEDTAPID